MSSHSLLSSSPTRSNGVPSRRLTFTFTSGSASIRPSATRHSASFSSTGRIPDLTPQEYKEAIAFHARQTTRISPYPGQNFEDLDLFLQRSNASIPIHPTSSHQLAWLSPLATLYTLENYATNTLNVTTNSAGIWRQAEHFNTPVQLTEHLRSGKSTPATSYILFLAGYPASEWLTTVGSLFQVDPEHYQRHLMFSPRQLYFSTPSLPSASENIVTLRFITIGCRRPRGTSQDHVDQLRDDGARDMNVYKHRLQLNREHVKAGDSIVRRYSVHDETYFSIEQEMSISLNYFEKQWIVLILLDAGNNLSESLRGPWLTEEDRLDNTRWKTTFLPTIRHRPKLALKSKKYALPKDEQGRNGELTQAGSFLPRDYGKLLEWPLMKVDPFYALHELFEFSASSELQFLNLIEDKLGPETTYEILAKETPSLSNLLYHLEILQAHARQLTETIRKIKCRGNSQWPHAPEDTDLDKKAKESANILLRDYEFLLTKAQLLADRCEKGMAVIMNNANIAESKRAIIQAERVSKLTLLAFFYVPLSFTASFFGMNFAQFSTGPYLGIWVWFVASVPVLILSFLFYHWDVAAFSGRSWRRVRKHWKNVW